MKRSVLAGFTLIELLVVMTIIALLTTFLIPAINGALLTAKKTADSASLRWHWVQLTEYKRQTGHLPQQEGHKFVLAPWVEGIVERTETNRDHYFSTALDADVHLIDLREQHIDDIWNDFDSVSSSDTHFAGASLENRRHMTRGRRIWMATDNEGGNTYPDGSVLMLFGDCTVKELTRAKQVRLGAPKNQTTPYTIVVGPTSPHEDLRKLRK